MKLASSGILLIAALCNPFPAYADQVATHAAAINDLREIQIQYLRDATVSGDEMVNYAYTKSWSAGREAACDNVAVEDVPNLAEENAKLLNEQLQPLMTILHQFTRASVPIPIGGTMRDNFLRGFDAGCEKLSITEEDNVNSALEMLDAASLIQREIERRESVILQALAGQE